MNNSQLQKYLKQHDVLQTLQEAVNDAIVTDATDPIRHIVAFLRKRQKDQLAVSQHADSYVYVDRIKEDVDLSLHPELETPASTGFMNFADLAQEREQWDAEQDAADTKDATEHFDSYVYVDRIKEDVKHAEGGDCNPEEHDVQPEAGFMSFGAIQ